MVLLVSGSQLFLRATGKWQSKSSAVRPLIIPVKYLSWLRTDYMPMQEFTLLAVVCKPADRPAVATSLNRDLARIHEWCNHWCVILNPDKTKALVVSRSMTVNPPLGDLVLTGGFHLRKSQPRYFWREVRQHFKNHVRGIVFRFSQRFGVLRLVKRVFVDTSVLLRCNYAFVLKIHEYCSLV